MVANVMFVSLNGCFMTPIWTRKKWIIDVMTIRMMEGLDGPSGQFRPHQASCAASAIFPGVPFFFLTSRRVILISLSQRYSSLSAIGRRRGVGTTRGPSWQRCIKAAMSHPGCQAYRTVSKGGSSVPLFSPSRQSALSLPCLFASSLSFLTSYAHPLSSKG